MATTLPNHPITPIPDTEPEAVPSLWNTRYVEIDQNFTSLRNGINAAESEIAGARGGKPDIGTRINEMAGIIEGLEGTDPDYINTLTAIALQSLTGVGMLHHEIDRFGMAERDIYMHHNFHMTLLALTETSKTRDMRIQEGKITMQNRGVISGCTVTKSTTATRNITMAKGTVFLGGRSYTVGEQVNCASIPSNPGSTTKTCYVFLWIDGGGILQCDATLLGEPVPANGIMLYEVTVPAGSTDISDPNLGAVTLTSRRRIEPQWPHVMVSPVFQYVSLAGTIPGAEYAIVFDYQGHTGGPAPTRNDLVVTGRAANGFTVYYSGMADDITILYRAIKMNC